MRPLRLILQGFGPFVQPQVIDFRQLERRGFFLIHGPTGAGKTTILDALCFALYGQTSGPDREAEQMRSHFGPAGGQTQVTLDWALGQRTYRVVRLPAQDRPKLRGQGMVQVKPQATLFETTGQEIETGEGQVLAEGVQRVGEKIVDLLGFQADQFRQVIVLPQGRFRQLLVAGSRERQAILEVLFDAEKYRRLQEVLKKSAKELEEAIREGGVKRQLTLTQVGAAGPEEVRSRLDQARVRKLKLTADLALRRVAAIQAQADLAQARVHRDRLVAAREAAEALLAIEARTSEIAALRARALLARRAESVATAEAELGRRRQEAREAVDRLTRCRVDLKSADQVLARATASLAAAEAEAGKKPELRARLDSLAVLRVRVEELIRLGAEEASLRAEEENLHKQRDRFDHEVREFEAAQKKVEERLGAVAGLAMRVEALGLESQVLARRIEDGRRLAVLEEAIRVAETVHQGTIRESRKVDAELETARGDLEALEASWRQGQAGVLARELAPDQPCPVCGSRTHPAPAAALATVPTEALLNKKYASLKKMEQRRDQARLAQADREREIIGLTTERDVLTGSLGGMFTRLDLERLATQGEEKSVEWRAAREAASIRPGLEAELFGLKARRLDASRELAQAEAGLDRNADRRVRLVAEMDARAAAIPPALRTTKDLDAARLLAEKTLKALDRAVESAGRSAREAGEARAASQARVSELEGRVSEVGEHLARQEESFSRTLSAAGFARIEDFQAARAAPVLIMDWEENVNRYDQALVAARDRDDRARQSASGLTWPDLPAIEAATNRIAREMEAALQEEASLQAEIGRLETAWAELTHEAVALADLEGRYRLVGRLAEVAAGSSRFNRFNLTFQGFVLAALLDDVLVAATARLLVMSGGRYRLERESIGTDGRRNWGLDLRVFDAYTGQARGVATLSGGESFLASLSLALGLADVVQAYSGGIKLETIFVDEGFGHLDPEALDLALQALVDLQRGGRLVGIISHVPELKERLQARLEVTPTRAGSTVRFVLD